MKVTHVEKRVRLVRCIDPYTINAPGIEGTVTLVDDTGTVHVRWDNGSTRGLIPGVDRWEEVPPETKTIDIACSHCGAQAGERCSDAGVFIRDAAFSLRTTEGPHLTSGDGE